MMYKYFDKTIKMNIDINIPKMVKRIINPTKTYSHSTGGGEPVA